MAAILALVAAGAAVDAQADAGRLTALHGAAAMGHVEAIAALVGAGAALEARDKKQRTPLHLAAEHGRAAALKALLGAGAALFNTPRGGRRAEPRCAKAHDVRSFHPGQVRARPSLLATRTGATR